MLRPRGLPIGNLTSQFFANVLLDPIDHFLKDELRIPGYVRYCDDLVLFAGAKGRLWQAQQQLAEQLAAFRLRPSRLGLKFLGYVIWPEQRRLQQRALVRFNRRCRWLKAQNCGGSAAWSRSLQAWGAHAGQANAIGIQRSIWQRLRAG